MFKNLSFINGEAIHQWPCYTQISYGLQVFVKPSCRLRLRRLGKCFRIPQVRNRPPRQRQKRCQNLKRNAAAPYTRHSHPLPLYLCLSLYFTCDLLALSSVCRPPRFVMLIVSNLGHHRYVYFLFPPPSFRT